MLKKNLRKVLRRGKTSAQLELEDLKRRGLQIGKDVDIYSEYPFDANYPGLIRVGNKVTIAANVKILAHDASMGYQTNGAAKIGIVDIGDRVFIGAGSIILPNVRIGDDCVIGAGSVVTTDVPAGTVYAGNPAKFIKTTEEFKNQHMACMETHPTFTRPWREWREMSNEEWEDVRKQLDKTYGYVKRG